MEGKKSDRRKRMRLWYNIGKKGSGLRNSRLLGEKKSGFNV